jgi:tetratricopeptide (TPR) repeat protein
MFSNLSRPYLAVQAIELAVLFAISLLSPACPAQSNSVAQEHEQRANEYLREKNPKLAIEEFRSALSADPKNVEAAANLGVLLFFQKDYEGAIPYLRQASAQRSDLNKIRALLGLAEKYVGQTNEARADLEASVPRLDDSEFRIQAGLTLVEIDEASRDLYKAAGLISLLREEAPTDPEVLFAAYRIATEQAGEAMLSLSLVAPDSAQMHEAMAQELERALDNSGAIANLRKAAALDPTLPGIHYELGEALQEANDVNLRAEAESQFKLALEQNPRDANSTVALGNLARDRGDTQGAIKYYSQAYAIDPQLPDAAIALADVDADKGDFAAAAAKLELVVKADPSNMLAHYRLFTIYGRLKRPDDAKRELEAFQHYKQLKEKMQAIFNEMRQRVPGEEEQNVKK